MEVRSRWRSPRGARASRRGSRRFRLLPLLLVLVVAVACTSDEPDGASDDDPEIAVDLDAAPDAADLLSDDRGDPPDELVAQDLVVGDGEPAAEGAELTVQYLGVRWSDAGEFDSSWESGQPLRFELGAAQVIPGWERGVAGEGLDVDAMRVGGRRSLVIPPDLAYGDRGAGGVIGPDETLVFVVDLVDVDAAP